MMASHSSAVKAYIAVFRLEAQAIRHRACLREIIL
jgi:hypothetical protein